MNVPFANREATFTPFEGGFDVQTPPLFLEPGYARNAQNFECGILRGYSLVTGTERRDGRPAPSTAGYWILPANITGAYSIGNAIIGQSSGAIGAICKIASTNDHFILTGLTGAHTLGETLLVATSTTDTTDTRVVGTAIDSDIASGASSSSLDAQYTAAAANVFRDRIQAVPGAGSVRGVWFYNNTLYAFRDTTDGAACGMFRESSGGWVQLGLGYELEFTNGNQEVFDGETITGATSHASAVVQRVLLESGDWAEGTAQGRFVYASQSGTFGTESINVGTRTGAATLSGNSTAITLLPGGTYEFENANFGGASNTKRMYGVDGVNRGFEFDGTTYVPIRTGMTLDQPEHLTIHKNHLFYSFRGSVQFSALGNPYSWTLILGAGEIGAGDLVTAFQKQAGSSDGGALLICTRNRLSILYGASALDWNFVSYSEQQGAYSRTVQRLGPVTVFLDDRGLTTLVRAQIYGNFIDATLTQRIQTWINQQRTKAVSSCVCRDKGQYRLFFNDGYALYATFNGDKLRGLMPVLLPHRVTCTASTEMNDGTEVIFLGCDDGYVRQMERGTSFDGDPIDFTLDLAFDNQKRPRQRKRYKHLQFEVQGNGYAEFQVSHELGYNSVDIAQPSYTNVVTSFASGGTWDRGNWDTSVWDGNTLMPSSLSIGGTAENISIKIRGSSDYYVPFTLSGVLIDFSQRRKLR